MADPRELIMARLLVVASGIAGVTYAARNVEQIDEGDLPAIVVNEGDEDANDSDPDRRPPTAPRRVQMMPQIVIAAGHTPETVGTELNALRAKVIKAVQSDATLKAMTHDGVGIRYIGLSSDLALGRKMMGQMALNFSLSYILNPAAL